MTDFKIKIVNEHIRLMRIEVGGKKHWLEPNHEWEFEIDSTEDSSLQLCNVWTRGVECEPRSFDIGKENNVKFLIRKHDGIYKANFDGSNEQNIIKFDIDYILAEEMARQHFDDDNSPCRVKVVNEDEYDHEILFEINEKKKWISKGQEFEAILDPNLPTTTGICTAWLNGADEPPMEFFIGGQEKDSKFMIRHIGIYVADFDGSNERCFMKFSHELVVDSHVEKLKCFGACNFVIKNEFHDDILFELDGEKHQLLSNEFLEKSIDDDNSITEFCKTQFRGLNGELMELKVGRNERLNIQYDKDNKHSCILDLRKTGKRFFVVLTVVQEYNSNSNETTLQQINDEAARQTGNAEVINGNAKQTDQDIFIDNKEARQWVFLVGKDGSLNKCLGCLIKKRKLEKNDKFEEPLFKKPRIFSITDFIYNDIST